MAQGFEQRTPAPRSGNSRPSKSVRRVLMIALAAVVLLLSSGSASADPALVALSTLTLNAEQVSDLTKPVELHGQGPLDAARVLTGVSDKEQLDKGITDQFLSRVSKSVRQGYEREFATTGADEMIRIRVVEFVNHSWAAAMSHTENPQGPPNFPPGTNVGHLDGAHGGTQVGVRNSVGRILVVVTIATPMDAAAPQVTPALYEALSRQAGAILNAQMKALPTTADVTSGEALDKSGDRVLLGSALVASIAILALGYTASISVRDSGTRERFRRQERPSSDVIRIVDLTGSIRHDRTRMTVVSLAKLAALCGWAWFCYFEIPGVRLASMMGLIVGGICLYSAVDIWWKSRNGQAGTTVLGLVPASLAIGAAASVFGVGGLLIVLAATGFWFFVGTYFWMPALAFALLAIRAMSLTAKPLRLAKRLAAPSVTEALARDNRAEVMLLRSFQDDDLEIRMHASARHTALEVLSTEPYERFEELLAWTLWSYGPVLAIGQPDTVLQPLGAAREYHDDDSWQDAVRERIRHSRIVAFVVGRSPGLLWEARTVCELNALGKAMFVFPPEEPDEMNNRIRVLCAALDLNPNCIPHPSRRTRPIVAMYFADDGTPVVVTARGRDDIAYRRAIDYAATQVTATERPPLRRPRPDLIMPEQIVDDILTSFDPTYRRPPRKKVVKAVLDVVMGLV